MSKFQHHFFVCQTQRPPMMKPSCGPKGAADVLQALMEGLAQKQELWGKVQVTSCGCLGPCDEGPNVVVYPEGVWYKNVQPKDVPEIVEQHMLRGKPVERLVYNWPS